MESQGLKRVAKRKKITERSVRESDKPFIPHVQVQPENTDGDVVEDDGLTMRQRLFVDAITGPALGNATRAAEIAGYRSDNHHALQVTASETLNKPVVQEAIAHRFAQKKLSPEWAKATLADIASSSFANYMTIDASGNAAIDFAKASAAGAIGHIQEVTEEVLKTTEGGAQVIRRKVKLHDRSKALGMLLKFHGLLIDRHDHTSGGKPIKAFLDVDDGDEPGDDVTS